MPVVCFSSAWFGLHFDALYDRPLVFHSPMGYGPLFRDALTLANVHDLTFLEHPEWHPVRTSFFMRETVPRVVRKPRIVICHSDYVRGSVLHTYGLDPSRVVVLPPPIGHTFAPMKRRNAIEHVARRFGLHGDFILHVSTLEPRKNQVRLIEAFERMRRAGFPGPLVMVGRNGWKVRPILSRLE